MNEVKQIKLTIEGDVWEAFEKDSLNELDDLILKLKEKKLLAHIGNVKTTYQF